ncbi:MULTISPECIES: sugar O-acetyltransferase [Clostridium]|uniref:Acetyltransferase n=2 Tax=Clostridium perfringens TaxID=1502 RepID=A0ABD4PXY1_CLOPF|nr:MULTISPECIES: sugar O-acetyltransferase [Clostridium]ABG84539.1 galactoside O-acetyltransferase [Clostridium perfringens ATCC 13124]AQW25548.1 galactoside O-acetyltransferase [Clostridium perfringens]ATD49822.1 sugar O-acetyltransferase [Clostridium perfringens]EGT0683376.1 sugar O-acetyltransferase [Clostridium perfringens]EGT0686079.1 sugar O-acetyltransferase [Clostridium perfringens]
MDLKEIRERMYGQKLYYCNDEDLMREQMKALELLYDFNKTRPSEQDKREKILKKMFAEIGDDCYIEPPFHANWGGKNVHFGNGVYANFNLTMVDDCDIFVGNNVMFGPNVTVSAGTHPIHPELRSKQAQYNIPIHIGNNVWIGANSVILPGVNIGDNSVIGAGSIVTKDIPSNVVAVGNPCRVLREINENDMKYYYRDMKIDIE